jgi:protein pelota
VFSGSTELEGCSTRVLPRSRVVNVSATGSTDSHRVRTSLTLSVTRMHFSPSASSSTSTPGASSTSQGGAMLQITGRVTVENPYVKMGAFHTLDVEINRDVKISKEEWDSISLERVTEACVEGRGAEVGAIVCGEGESP